MNFTLYKRCSAYLYDPAKLFDNSPQNFWQSEMSEVDLWQSNNYLVGIGAAFLVLFVYTAFFWLLRLIANFLIGIIIFICAVLPFFILQSGTLSSTSDIWAFSAGLGAACAIVCLAIYPYSSIYENKMKEKIEKAILHGQNLDI